MSSPLLKGGVLLSQNKGAVEEAPNDGWAYARHWTGTDYEWTSAPHFEGNVGINVTSPDTLLHIVSPGASQLASRTNFVATANAYIIENATSNINMEHGVGTGKFVNWRAWRSGDTVAFGIHRWEESTGDFIIRTASLAGGGPYDRWRVQNDGTILNGSGTYQAQVGINVTTPNSAGLHIIANGSSDNPTPNGATHPLNIQKDDNVILGIFTPTGYEARIQFGQITTGSGRMARIAVPTATGDIHFEAGGTTLQAKVNASGGIYTYGSTTANQVRLTSANGSYYNYLYSNVSASANFGLVVNTQGTDRFTFLNGGGFSMPEQASAPSASAGSGYQWVKNATPNEMWFTDDAGTDVQMSMSTGTWTPTLQDSSFSDSESQTYAVQDGKYWVVGNLCFIWVDIEVTSLGSLTTTEPAYIAGLPFNPTAGFNNMGVQFQHGGSLSVTAGQQPVGRLLQGTPRMLLQLWDAASGTSSMLISEVSAGGRLIGNGWYRMQ